MQGQVLEVNIVPAGDELAAAHLLGDTTIDVMDTDEFSDAPGTVQIEGILYDYSAVDRTALTLTLTTGLAADTEEATKVFSVPLTEEKWAMVEVQDNDEPISARIEHALKDKMTDGVREPEDQETVVLELVDGDWTVTDIIQEIPVLDGTYIPVDTLPQPETSDGNAPSSSPLPEVIGGIGAFYLRWTPPANADPMQFEVHASATNTSPPDATTFCTQTSAYSTTLRNLPTIDLETGEYDKFEYDLPDRPAPYYFAIIAKDEDGPAAPSAWVDGRLFQITGPDIAAETIRGENIIGETLTGNLFSGTVLLGSTISTGALDEDGNLVGARVDISPLGISTVDANEQPVVQFPTDSSVNAFVRADVEMLSAKVVNNFSMFGTNNLIAKDGRLMLSAGVTPPSSPPIISYEYDTLQLNTTTAVPPHTPNSGYNLGTFRLDPSQITSIAWNSDWGAWVVIQQKSNGFRVWRFTTTGAIYNNLATGRPWVDDYNSREKASNAFGSGTGQGSGEAALFKSGDDWYVWGPYINKIPASWITDTAARPPTLGYIPSNNRWMLVQNDGGGSGVINIRQFTLNSGTNADGSFKNATSQSNTNLEAGSGLAQRINGAVNAPIVSGGASRWVISSDTYQTMYVFSGSTEMNDEGTYEEWLKPGAALGMTHNGSQFCSIDAGGKITFYTDWNWPTLNATAWVGASAYDSDTGGDPANPHTGQTAGQHETPVGTMVSFSQRRRARLVITMPETPDSGGNDDVDKWKLYYARQSSTPAKANLKYIDMIGSPTARTSKVVSSDPTGGNPPGGIYGQSGAVNNFPQSNPAKIVSVGLDASSNPVIELTGDGAGRMGPYKWDKNGNDLNDTGWINASLTGGWSNYGSPYVGAQYRRIGKMVMLRGLVQGGGFGSANPILTLPVGFRPGGGVAGNDLIMMGTVQNRTISISNLAAKETGDPDDNVTTSTSGHTHNMKQHHHPISAYSITNPVPTNMVSRVDVMSDGRVHCATDGGAWVSLSGIAFLVD